MQISLTLALLAAGLAAAPPRSTTSTAEKTFVVPFGRQHVAEWYEAHRSEVMAASNCRVLASLGQGTYKVETRTPVGACQYILKETRLDRPGADGRLHTTYRTSYLRNVSGRLVDHELTIDLVEVADGQTQIAMALKTSVAGALVPVRLVRIVQDNCLSGAERFITSQLR